VCSSGFRRETIEKEENEMSWKFWEKSASKEVPEKVLKEKALKTREIPDTVGRELVTKMGKDPDWVWKLKAALRQRPDAKSAFDFRIFSEEQAGSKKVAIKNYDSLDANPELILFEGWYDKKTNKVEVRESGKTDKVDRAA
jgi:hypothetical protein